MKRNLKIAIKRAQTELARRMPSVSDLRKKWLYLILLAISANALADMGGAIYPGTRSRLRPNRTPSGHVSA